MPKVVSERQLDKSCVMSLISKSRGDAHSPFQTPTKTSRSIVRTQVHKVLSHLVSIRTASIQSSSRVLSVGWVTESILRSAVVESEEWVLTNRLRVSTANRSSRNLSL